MDIQFSHITLGPEDTLPALPARRAYALVLVAHASTDDMWRRALAEQLAVGACVQVNIWGEDSDDWQDAISVANDLAVLTEERCETLPDILTASQSGHILEDVFEYCAAGLKFNEAEDINLLILMEIGTSRIPYNMQHMACKAAGVYGVQAGQAC